MSTIFTVTVPSSVPSGSYSATFLACEKYQGNVEQFGEGVILRFQVNSGEYKGQETSRICSRTFSTKSNLFQFAKALYGRDLTGGDTFDFADHVGAKGIIVVEKTDSGATRVATFLRAAE